MIYYKLYPKRLSYNEACQALIAQGLPPRACPECFSLDENEVSAAQLEKLSELFSIQTFDTEEEKAREHKRSLKAEFSHIQNTDEYMDKLSEVAKQYQSGQIGRIDVARQMKAFCLSQFPDSAEAIEFAYRNLS